MDGAGNTLAVLGAAEHPRPELQHQMSSRDTGGTFHRAGRPGPEGHRTAAWRWLRTAKRLRSGSASPNPPGVYVIEAATRPPGGSFSPPVTPSTRSRVDGDSARVSSVAIGTGGAVVVTWTEIDPASIFTEYPDVQCGTNPDPPEQTKSNVPIPRFAMASVRPAGGVFHGSAADLAAHPPHRPAGEPANSKNGQ